MKLNAMVCACAIALGAASAANAHTEVFKATLSGPNEFPSNASPATGTATVTLDLDLATMRVVVDFSGLLGNVTASHIHCCTNPPGFQTAGVATPTPTFPGFPSGVKSGHYDQTFNLGLASSYNGAFFTANGGTASGAMNALVTGIEQGRAYLNIHTASFGGGEIRGFLALAPVPEPETYALMLAGLGLVGVAAVRRRAA